MPDFRHFSRFGIFASCSVVAAILSGSVLFLDTPLGIVGTLACAMAVLVALSQRRSRTYRAAAAAARAKELPHQWGPFARDEAERVDAAEPSIAAGEPPGTGMK